MKEEPTKRCEKLGVEYKKYLLPADATQEQVLAVIDEVNKDDSIHGVLLFRPLPKHLNQDEIEQALDPAKDVDCMTNGSMAGVFTGKDLGISSLYTAGLHGDPGSLRNRLHR